MAGRSFKLAQLQGLLVIITNTFVTDDLVDDEDSDDDQVREVRSASSAQQASTLAISHGNHLYLVIKRMMVVMMITMMTMMTRMMQGEIFMWVKHPQGDDSRPGTWGGVDFLFKRR